LESVEPAISSETSEPAESNTPIEPDAPVTPTEPDEMVDWENYNPEYTRQTGKSPVVHYYT
jgi:hypothetical protein